MTPGRTRWPVSSTRSPTTVGQYAYLAHMNGVLGVAKGVDYTPDSATGDEMHLAAMSPSS